MSINEKDIRTLVEVAAALAKRIQAGGAITDTATDILAVADFPALPAEGNTTAKIAGLVNRYYAENLGADKGIAPSNRPQPMTTT
jgi:hypothetical protein